MGWRRGMMLLAGLLVLSVALCLRPASRQAQPNSSRVSELRDRFLVENVARPMRDRLDQARRPSLQSEDRAADREQRAQVPPVPFLVPFAFVGPSCVEQVCNLVGSLGCDTDQRILRVLRMCNGNVSGDCVRAACGKLISVACDTLESIAPTVAACRSNISGGCLEAACRLLGDVQCQTQAEIAHILDVCAGNIDGSCVTSVCARISPAGCTTMDELSLVAQACGSYGYGY